MASKFKADKCFRYTDEDGNIIISFKVSGYDRRLAEMAAESSKTMTAITVEVKEQKTARSLEQNAMLWALLTKLAQATAGDRNPETVNKMYCTMLEQANIESEYIMAAENTEAALLRVFRAIQNIGTREITDKKGKTRTLNVYQCFIGSSKFDVKQMTELIEITLDKCAEFGIYDADTERIRNEYRQ